jgi:hypothetical protein
VPKTKQQQIKQDKLSTQTQNKNFDIPAKIFFFGLWSKK